MEDIIYRTIKKEDYKQISNLIAESFDLNSYIVDEESLKEVKEHYLYSCLAEATYINIAEIKGKIIGVIMGNSKNDYKLYKHIIFIAKIFKYRLKKQLTRENDLNYKQIQIIYKELLDRHKNKFDGILTLFLVDKKYRGLGIGYKLFTNLLLYLKNKRTNRIYLYTDSECNYHFYEKQGFNLLEIKACNLLKNNKNFNMDIFLYEYQVK